jgi:replicative DNA helicase
VEPEVRLAYEFRLIELLEGVAQSAQSAQSAEPSSPGSDCADLVDSAAAGGPAELVLDDRAREILWEFRRRLEPRLNPNTGDLYGASDWAGKLEGSCVRIAGLLHFYEHGWSVGLSTAIEADRMVAAVAVADYLVPHALIALGLTGPRSTSAARACAVLRWIRREKRTQFKASDVLDAVSRSVVPDMSTVDAALTLLEDLRYVRRRMEEKTGRPGRPPSPAYDVNPLLDVPR